MDLLRDVQDKLVVDRDGREIGRVDRVLVSMGDDGPRVVALEIGPAVLAGRVSRRLGRWVSGLERALSLDDGRPARIPISEILDIHEHIRISRAFGDTPAARVETLLRRWLPRLPGA